MPCITPKIAYSKIYTIFFSHYSDAELPLKLYVYKIWNGWQQYNRHYNLVVGFTFGPYQPTIEFVFRSRSSPRTFIFNSILVLHIILVLDESLSHYNGLVRRLSSWLNLILQSVNSFFFSHHSLVWCLSFWLSDHKLVCLTRSIVIILVCLYFDHDVRELPTYHSQVAQAEEIIAISRKAQSIHHHLPTRHHPRPPG